MTIDSAHVSIAPSRANSPQSRILTQVSTAAGVTALAAESCQLRELEAAGYLSSSTFADPSATLGKRGRDASRERDTSGARIRSQSKGASSCASYGSDSSIVDSEGDGGMPLTSIDADVVLARRSAKRASDWPKLAARKCRGLPEGESATGNLNFTYFNFGEQGKKKFH